MNLIEVFKSKRPCRRPNRTFTYTDRSGFNNKMAYLDPTQWKAPEFLLEVGALRPDDIIADDWELKPEDERPL